MEFVLAIERWVHFLSGVMWIGLLYYFNFVQVPAIAAANADKGGPGPAAINKYVAPRALLWFRWGSVVTWLSGAALLGKRTASEPGGRLHAARPQPGHRGRRVARNHHAVHVWGLIWPNQKKVLGIVSATDEEKNRARRVALLASRTNTLL